LPAVKVLTLHLAVEQFEVWARPHTSGAKDLQKMLEELKNSFPARKGSNPVGKIVGVAIPIQPFHTSHHCSFRSKTTNLLGIFATG